MFNHSEHTIINGGHFTSVVSHVKGGFERLLDHVATSAFHNAAQRIDPPRCHENTRQAVLKEIFDWILQDDQRTAWIAWLNGAAGSGKSAICQSVAEICIERKIMVASFFLFRADATRNSLRSFAATTAYQLIQLIPDIKSLVVDAIEANPLIFEQDLYTQIDSLVITPLRNFQHLFGSNWSLLLIIDGVDECQDEDSQMDLIRTLARMLIGRHLPIYVLFGSRPENHIKMTFSLPAVSENLFNIPLDDHYLPNADIQRFLDDSFRTIRTVHPMCQRIPADWPSPDLVQEIVAKSSGQFIYASSVVKFVSLPKLHPTVQLDIVRGLRAAGIIVPFAELDALYRHILSTVQDLTQTMSFLAYSILSGSPWIPQIASFYHVTEDDVYISMTDLTSVIICEGDQIRFLHTSLIDFLLDKRRAQQYHLDASLWATKLSIIWFQNAASLRCTPQTTWDPSIVNLLIRAAPTPELGAHIKAFHPYTYKIVWRSFFTSYLRAVKTLNFGDAGAIYLHQLDAVESYLADKQVQLVPPESLEHRNENDSAEPNLTMSRSVLTPASLNRLFSLHTVRLAGNGEIGRSVFSSPLKRILKTMWGN